MDHSRAASLEDYRWHPRPVQEALNGVRIPDFLGLEVVQLCIIRGIRHHDGFGQELRGLTPAFTRALNAQAIMYNHANLPDMKEAGAIPYCIWDPAVPSKDTCRRLVKCYPHMAYQVGRVCAVAGYDDVYAELDIIPEVAIAEEARNCGQMNIFQSIVVQPIRFAVFNDYDRRLTLENPPAADLNGDTCIKSKLQMKQNVQRPGGRRGLYSSDGFDRNLFNITEDMNVTPTATSPTQHDQLTHSARLTNSDTTMMIPLLFSPLPRDLPPGDKDILILIAAYHGDIDRYVRLRRPKRIDLEVNCVVRGIYHNVPFAKWWSMQTLSESDWGERHIRLAVDARFIMCNDLSRVIDPQLKPRELPYCIWYPQPAAWPVYEELAKLRPEMRLQAARACIVADYERSFDVIDPPFDAALAREAKASPNPHYIGALERQRDLGRSTDTDYSSFEGWKLYTMREALRSSSDSIGSLGVSTQPWIYDGLDAYISNLEVTICTPDEVREAGVKLVADRYPGST